MMHDSLLNFRSVFFETPCTRLIAKFQTVSFLQHLASFPLSPGDKVISAKERLQKAKVCQHFDIFDFGI